ncbi:MAG: hypothetical protein KDB27_14410 [Planctomycetales bacterium]|nr:hypothetical protein [Planctomycetales bacterium]
MGIPAITRKRVAAICACVVLASSKLLLAQATDEAAARNQWKQKVEQLNSLYDEVRAARRSGDSEAAAAAFRRHLENQESLREQQRQRVRENGKSRTAWHQVDELEKSVERAEELFNRTKKTAPAEMNHLIEKYEQDYKVHHRLEQQTSDPRERQFLNNRQYVLAATIDQLKQYRLARRFVLTREQSLKLARLQTRYGDRYAYDADPDLQQRIDRIGHGRSGPVHAINELNFEPIDPPIIPTYQPPTRTLDLNLELANGPIQDARRELGCLLSMEIRDGELHLHKDNVREYLGGLSRTTIENSVSEIVKSHPAVHAAYSMPVSNNRWEGQNQHSSLELLLRHLSYRFGFEGSSVRQTSRGTAMYGTVGARGTLDFTIWSTDGFAAKLTDSDAGSTVLINAQTPLQFELNIMGTNSLWIKQDNRGTIMVRCESPGFEKSIAEKSYLVAYEKHMQLFEEYVFVLLDHIGIRLPLHRFHPQVIETVHEQRGSHVPVEKATEQELRRIKAQLESDDFHQRRVAFNKITANLYSYKDLIHRPEDSLSLDMRTRFAQARSMMGKLSPEEAFVEQLNLLNSKEYLRLLDSLRTNEESVDVD